LRIAHDREYKQRKSKLYFDSSDEFALEGQVPELVQNKLYVQSDGQVFSQIE